MRLHRILCIRDHAGQNRREGYVALLFVNSCRSRVGIERNRVSRCSHITTVVFFICQEVTNSRATRVDGKIGGCARRSSHRVAASGWKYFGEGGGGGPMRGPPLSQGR